MALHHLDGDLLIVQEARQELEQRGAFLVQVLENILALGNYSGLCWRASFTRFAMTRQLYLHGDAVRIGAKMRANLHSLLPLGA